MPLTGNEQTRSGHLAIVVSELECDEDEAAFDEKLRDIAKHKPVPEKPE